LIKRFKLNVSWLNSSKRTRSTLGGAMTLSPLFIDRGVRRSRSVVSWL